MFVHRRITLACAVAAMAVAPSSALAMPATDPPAPTPVVARPRRPRGRDRAATTPRWRSCCPARRSSIAAGAAAVSGHDHRRIGRVA